MKGIPVIEKQDVSVTKALNVGHYAGFLFKAQWTRPDGVQVCAIVEWVGVVKVKRVSGPSYQGVLASTKATGQRNFVALVLVQFYGNLN